MFVQSLENPNIVNNLALSLFQAFYPGASAHRINDDAGELTTLFVVKTGAPYIHLTGEDKTFCSVFCGAITAPVEMPAVCVRFGNACTGETGTFYIVSTTLYFALKSSEPDNSLEYWT